MSDPRDRDLDLKVIVGFAVALVLVLVASSVFLWYFSKYLRSLEVAEDPPPPALEAARAPYEPPGPKLQTDPAREMAELREEEEAILGSYAWVDEANGIARIPIDRAIALLAGEPAVENGPTPDNEVEAVR